jgi:hypothetical protein
MFLSKRNGVYHLFYDDATGKRHSRSTGARTKPEVVEFLRSFDAEQDAKERSRTGDFFQPSRCLPEIVKV